jgi:hypothetical protein
MKYSLKNTSFIFLLYIINIHLFAQAPDTAWTRTFGGSSDDYGYLVRQTEDGGYIIAGETRSYGEGKEDVYLIKTNHLGDTLWTKTFGGPEYDIGRSVQQTEDGGYIIAGSTNSYGAGGCDVYLIKTNSGGYPVWTKTFGAAGSNGSDYGHSVQQTTDGGYIIAGETVSYSPNIWSDVYLIKVNSSGDTLWTRTYGGADQDVGYSVQQTKDGGYIIAGYTKSFGEGADDVYLIKTDSLGDTLWTKTFAGHFGTTASDRGYSVRQTTDGGYIIAGKTGPASSVYRFFYVIKTDSIGDTLWTRESNIGHEWGYSVWQTIDEEYIIAGTIDIDIEALHGIYLIRMNPEGDTLWSKIISETSHSINYRGYSVQQTEDEGYIIAGYTNSHSAGGNDVYLMKIKPEVSGIEESTRIEDSYVSPPYPNPFTDKTSFSYELPNQTRLVNISIYNVLGQEISKLYYGKKATGIHTITWDGTDTSGKTVPSGIYFLKLKIGEKMVLKRLTFIR